MRCFSCLAAVLFGILLVCPRSWSDDGLYDARKALRHRNHVEALAAARPFLESPRPGEVREARMITAEALIELGRFSDAIAILAPMFGHRPPGARDAPWVRLLARSLQGQGLLLEAADWWLTYATLGHDESREGERNLRRLLGEGLSQSEIAYLLWKYPRHELFCQAVQDYAEAEAEAGHPHEALEAWHATGALCRDRRRSAGQLPVWLASSQEEEGPRDFFTVGLLAPLNGPFARFGIAMANGADVARRLHNASARFPLRLEIADTGGSPRGCLDAVDRLYERGICVFIGEVFSLHTLVASAYLRGRNAILVSPAATDSTVALMGPGAYCCTVGQGEQIAALVAYAVDSLEVRRVALLWPRTSAGRSWARQFSAEAEFRGIQVFLDPSYPPGTTDFAGLLEQSQGAIPDSIDAVVSPGGMKELVSLFSQLAHQGFLGPYIGDSPMGEAIVSGIVEEFGLLTLYPGDTYVPIEGGMKRPGFEETYMRLFGEAPDGFSYRGWVAFGLIGDAVERGGYCPEALRGILEVSAEKAHRRGKGRRLEMSDDVGLPAIFLRQGMSLRHAGRCLGSTEATSSDSSSQPIGSETEMAPPR